MNDQSANINTFSLQNISNPKISKNTKKATISLNAITKILVIASAFLAPIFFLPTTSEFFSFNKLALITITTLLLSVLWGIKIISGKKISFTKSVIDLPLLAVTLVVVLSAIFSLNKTISIFGSQGRWLGLFALLIMVSYYYLATPSFKDRKVSKWALYGLITSFTMSSLLSTLSYYKIYIANTPYLALQNFSLTGSTTEAAVLAALAIVLGFSLVAYEKSPLLKLALSAIIPINLLFILITNTPAAWAILATGVVGFILYIKGSKVIESKINYLMILGMAFALVLVAVIPITRGVLVDTNFPTEITLPFRESWRVASSTIQDYPILATGPSSFSMNYTRYKPLSMNNTNFWNVRFDKPYNELLNILGTLGIVGILAASYFVVSSIKLAHRVRKIKDDTGLIAVASIGFMALLVSFLFTYATILSTFLLFLMLAILVASQANAVSPYKLAEEVVVSVETTKDGAIESIGVMKKEYARYIVSTVLFGLAIYAGYLSLKQYVPEYYMRKAILAASVGNGSMAYEYQRRAINTNPMRHNYHTSYAQTNLAIANALASKKELTDQDKETIQALISQSIRSVKNATEVVNPLNSSAWEIRANIYRSIVNVAQDASDWAIASYNAAIQLDPTNPRLRLELGGVYYGQEDYLAAANLFRQATSLKADYANAHYNFAQSLLQLNDFEGALRSLELTKLLVPEGSVDFKIVEDQIAEINKLAQVAGADSEKPTVEELEGIENEEVVQEPLTTPGEEEQATGENLDVEVLPDDTSTSSESEGPTPETPEKVTEETPEEEPTE